MGHQKSDQPKKVKIAPVGCFLEGKQFLGSDYWLFLGITFVGGMLAGVVPLVLVGPAHCGIVLCLLNRARGKAVDFQDLFKGFDYFVPSLIATLVYFGVSFACMIPIGIVYFGAFFMMISGEAVLIGLGIGLLLLCYFLIALISMIGGTVFLFAMLLIVDRKMEGVPAIKLAWQAVWKNFTTIFFAEIVETIALLLATLMCFFPAIFLWPIIIAGKFIMYQKILGVLPDQDKPVVAQFAARL